MFTFDTELSLYNWFIILRLFLLFPDDKVCPFVPLRSSLLSQAYIPEWLALEMNRDNSVVFEITSKYCILDSFVDFEGYSISSKGVLPTILDNYMVICVKFTHSSPF